MEDCSNDNSLYTSPSDHGADEDQTRALQPLLDKYGVDLVMWGDNHNYERIKFPNKHTVFIQSGTGGESHYEFEGQIKESVYQNDNDYGITKIIINSNSLWDSSFLIVERFWIISA